MKSNLFPERTQPRCRVARCAPPGAYPAPGCRPLTEEKSLLFLPLHIPQLKTRGSRRDWQYTKKTSRNKLNRIDIGGFIMRNVMLTRRSRRYHEGNGWGGFEPPVPFGTHAFQACTIDRSVTHPVERLSS